MGIYTQLDFLRLQAFTTEKQSNKARRAAVRSQHSYTVLALSANISLAMARLGIKGSVLFDRAPVWFHNSQAFHFDLTRNAKWCSSS